MRTRSLRLSDKIKPVVLFLIALTLAACGLSEAETADHSAVRLPENGAEPSPEIPPAEIELVNAENSTTESSIGRYDFKNHTYPLPRGWQDADGGDITLVDGIRRTTEEKIGMKYLSTKYFDVTGDGLDEAVVILKIGTAGSAIPHIVYVFEWKEEEPALLWYFRTGDRADGGLKKVYAEDGLMAVELFGQDRFIFGEMETLKILGDEVQLCCPTHFTKTRYRWHGGTFSMDGDRLTYAIADPDSGPVVNMGDLKAKEERESRK